MKERIKVTVVMKSADQARSNTPRYSSSSPNSRLVKPDEEQYRRELDEINTNIESIKAAMNKLVC